LGLARLARLAPPTPVIRYERPTPGELVHLDVKKLGKIGRVGHRIHGNRATRTRGIGWEFLHVAIDDHSRLSYAEILPDEQGPTTAAFLVRMTAWFAQHGIAVERVLTDNGACYRSLVFATTALELGIGQRFTRPYRPQTNGKAERFIRTLLTEWAYARAYARSRQRTDALDTYLHFYNFHRRHSALQHQPPASRLPASL
jgi:transposase InsO family protein